MHVSRITVEIAFMIVGGKTVYCSKTINRWQPPIPLPVKIESVLLSYISAIFYPVVIIFRTAENRYWAVQCHSFLLDVVEESWEWFSYLRRGWQYLKWSSLIILGRMTLIAVQKEKQKNFWGNKILFDPVLGSCVLSDCCLDVFVWCHCFRL